MAKLSERYEAAHFNAHQAGFDFSVSDAALWIDDDLTRHVDRRIVKKAMSFLPDIQEKRLLIPGSGEAWEAIPLARAGANIIGIDISIMQDRIAKRRCEANGVDKKCSFICGSFNQLPLADNSVDLVYGHAVLHHIDLSLVGKELNRVLKPSGCYVFSEPFGENPLLEFVRNYVPYPGKHRNESEKPLDYADIALFQSFFSHNRVIEYQFLAMLERVIRKQGIGKLLDQVDGVLLKTLPFLKRWCRYVILAGQKKQF